MTVDQNGQVTIGLVQINNSFSGQNYLPYSVGLLQAYTEVFAKAPERYRFLPAVYRRMPVERIVESLVAADIVGISTYAWNGRISLEIARRLKQRKPEILIVFGGPHVPDQPEAFLRANDSIDIAVHNEGEMTFLSILEGYPERNWQALPGTSHIDRDGRFVRNKNGPRIRSLDEVPSPFLRGTFDTLMAENPQEAWIGLWETNRGCPFQCTFCDWGSATATKLTKFEMERLQEEVDWFARNKVEYIFCCDANFGILPRDEEISTYVAGVKRSKGYPKALSVQSTKNATDRAYRTQKILADAGLNKGVALSMQSMDGNTLKSIKRQNISLDTYLELQSRFNRDGIETYNDLILGLPGESYDSFVDGIDLLVRSGQHNRIQFNNLSILPNAEMGDPAYQAKYGMVVVESEIINIHGERVKLADDVPEVQDLVIATDAMPREDWVRTRAVCWMTAFLYFDKLFQMPLMAAQVLVGIPYRELFEWFMESDEARYPVIAGIRDFFRTEARSIQNGGPEYVFSESWLGIYWPADEYVFIKLTAENTIGQFYEEAEARLLELIGRRGGSEEQQALVREAARVNRALVNQPLVEGKVGLNTSYDVLGFYRNVKNGEHKALVKSPMRIEVDRSAQAIYDFQTWCREIVWWGNKKGAYLFAVDTAQGGNGPPAPDSGSTTNDLAGHY